VYVNVAHVLHHTARRALFSFASSIVRSVSFCDHEIGRQIEHAASVPPMPVVVPQLATSKALTSANVSLDSISEPPVILLGLNLTQLVFRVLAALKIHRKNAGNNSAGRAKPSANRAE
jgi:hypothetical protein